MNAILPTRAQPGPNPVTLDEHAAWQAIEALVQHAQRSSLSDSMSPDDLHSWIRDNIGAIQQHNPGIDWHNFSEAFMTWLWARQGSLACALWLVRLQYAVHPMKLGTCAHWLRAALCHSDENTRTGLRQQVATECAQAKWKTACLIAFVLAEGDSLGPVILDKLEQSQSGTMSNEVVWLWPDWADGRLVKHLQGRYLWELNFLGQTHLPYMDLLLQSAERRTDASAVVVALLSAIPDLGATDGGRTKAAHWLLQRAVGCNEDGLHGLRWLLQHSHDKLFIKPLRELPAQAPQALLLCLLDQLSGKEQNPVTVARVRRLLEPVTNAQLALWRASFTADQERTWVRLLATPAVVEAAPGDLPAVLQAPPWRRRKSALKPLPAFRSSVLARGNLPSQTALQPMDLATADRWLCQILEGLCKKSRYNDYRPHALEVRDSLPKTLSEAQMFQFLNACKDYFLCMHLEPLLPAVVPRLPRAIAVHVCSIATWVSPAVLAEFEPEGFEKAAVAMFAKFSGRLNDDDAPWHGFAHSNCAGLAAHALATNSQRRHGATWLLRHPLLAAYGLLPAALNTPVVDPRGHKEAVAALRWLAQQGQGEAMQAAVDAYGAHDAWAALVIADPLELVPPKPPKLPDWFDPAALPQPVLHSGAALPDSAVRLLGEMLQFSKLDTPYAGLALMREACTTDSLAAFAWGVFMAWLTDGGGSPAGYWAMYSLAHWGDDKAARQLTTCIRKWPNGSAATRALVGLDVLAAMGSDVALTNLNAIALKSPSSKLRDHATTCIQEVAERLELTREQLADRCAPDLGLDLRGRLTLDFGPRQFEVRLDAHLVPSIFEGKLRLKSFPRANKDDDPAKASAAAAQWKALKKDADTVVRQQVSRLEVMLMRQRSVSSADFQRYFVAHPLMGQLSQRLLWRCEGTCFRISEDLTPADGNDQACAFPTGQIHLAHPLQLTEAEKSQWQTLFDDYEIIPPFEQMGRACYFLSDKEKTDTRLDRFQGQKVYSMALRSLYTKGWPLSGFDTGHGTLHMDCSPGLAIYGEDEREQTLGTLVLRNSQTLRPFSDLNAVEASEMLRIWTLLVQAGPTRR